MASMAGYNPHEACLESVREYRQMGWKLWEKAPGTVQTCSKGTNLVDCVPENILVIFRM